MQLLVAGTEGAGWLLANRQDVLTRLRELRSAALLAGGRLRASS
jgi:hypothetical protein